MSQSHAFSTPSRTPAAMAVDQLNKYGTTAHGCGCDDYQFSDSIGFVCGHMRMVRDHGDQLQQFEYTVRVGNREFPSKAWKLVEVKAKPAAQPAAPAQRPAKPARTTALTVNRNYRRLYGSTPTSCRCPRRKARPAEACKHMQLETLRAEVQRAVVRRMTEAARKGFKARDARMDVLYSTYDYHRSNRLENGQRVDAIALAWLASEINRWERFYGGDLAQSIEQRMDRRLSNIALGRSVLPA